MLLQIIGRPTRARGGRAAAEGCWVQAKGQARFLRRRIDGPVAPPPQRLGGARRDDDLPEGLVLRPQLDFLHAEIRILLRRHHARQQARLLADPVVQLPVIDRMGEHGGEIGIALLHAALAEGDEHAPFHPHGIEMLAAHHVEVRAGRAAAGRIGVGALARRHHARIGLHARHALTDMGAEGLAVLAPALAHVGVKIVVGALHRMDVAIDDADLLGCGDRGDWNIHDVCSAFWG